MKCMILVIVGILTLSLPIQSMQRNARQEHFSWWQIYRVAILAGKVSPYTRDEHGFSMLIHAAQEGDDECLEFLLSLGVNINEQAKGINHTALSSALQSRHVSTVRLLIQRGIDVSKTPWILVQAIEVKLSILLPDLIAAGADIEEFSTKWDTPLISAIFHNDEDAVKILLDCGASVHTSNADDIDPMTMSIKMNRPDIALLLLQRGANLNVVRNLLATRSA